MLPDKSGEWQMDPELPLPCGAPFQLAVWVKGTADLDAYISIRQREDGAPSGKTLWSIWGLHYSPDTWTYNASTRTIDCTPGQDYLFTIYLGFNSPSGDPGSLWFDDVSFGSIP